ncbi:LysR substrate-binding domain-containing protein [Neptunicella marina]|uniref:LysR family transcriptional regulator n=1 Tax=Neptunicella marina TaxID=2125989 RepID=A0A8J6M284_9ALTE|nr:LysR substrate-binding domain-containing protein [Neptunicella marina]MBC3765982.1 LysR family transcriptional regulator [Neptunicella marina]
MDKRLRHIGLLRCFAAAAKHQSYSDAAEELAISQAAVSQQIRSLEQQLMVKLFKRNGRAMLLTSQGKTLQDYVNKAFSLLSEGFDRVQVEPEAGVLNVTTGLSFASIWLVPRLWRFSALHPSVTVKVFVSAELENVKHSELDVAIRQGDKIDHTVYNELLFTDPVFPVCSPNLIKNNNLSSPQQIGCCQLIEASGPGRFSWQNWFDTAGVAMQSSQMSWLEVSTLEMGINAVMAGQGICLAPKCLVSDLITNGLLVKPFNINIEPGQNFTLLYDQDSPRLARIQIFSRWLKQELADAGITKALLD